MKVLSSTCLLSVLVLSTAACGAEAFDDAIKRAASDYTERLRQASDKLSETRERIARERAPLLTAQGAAEERIIAAESEITRLDTAQEQSQEKHRQALRDADALRKNLTYLGTLGRDSLKAFDDGVSVAERQLLAGPLQIWQEKFADSASAPESESAVEVADFLLQRVQQALGGYPAPGTSLVGDGNQVVKGTFAFVGPVTYFQPDGGGSAGEVRSREGLPHPVSYVLSGWKPADAAAFFAGKPGTLMADATAGKALRLRETKGTVWQHIQKGGVVAYAILGVGLLALLMTLQKLRDLSRLAVDQPAAVERFLATLGGAHGERQPAVGALLATTRELFSVGLRHRHQPKEILEEHLYAVLLRQRLHYERWLPLLAVIATAAPLMGLLGTVTGLVKTFALINVFGTGNAGKLASGISEVLVATELGLMVAIPTLVAHGFLSHRIQKNLSLLERYALEFVTAVETDKPRAAVEESTPV
jgi:biopolymer transport protein ExbB